MNEPDIINFCTVLPTNKKIFSETNNNKLRAAVLKDNLWKKSTIKIKFLNKPQQGFIISSYQKLLDECIRTNTKLDPLQEKYKNLTNENLDMIPDIIKEIILERYQKFLKLDFVFVDETQDADIRIEFTIGKGCSSVIGSTPSDKTQKDNTMHFSWFNVKTVLHEFGHALGMIHEHRNPDGKIKWNTKEVYKWGKKNNGWDEKKTYEQVIKPYITFFINGTKYDPKSIMLYTFPPELTLNNLVIAAGSRLSYDDVHFLAKCYPPTKEQLSSGKKLTPDIFLQTAYPSEYSAGKIKSIKTQTQNFAKIILLTIISIILIIGIVYFIKFIRNRLRIKNKYK